MGTATNKALPRPLGAASPASRFFLSGVRFFWFHDVGSKQKEKDNGNADVVPTRTLLRSSLVALGYPQISFHSPVSLLLK